MMRCDCGGSVECCIKSVPMFSGLSDEEIFEIARIITSHTYEKGKMVYRAGDGGGKLFIVHTGRVKISRINANGKEQVLRIVEQGDFIGELSLFSSMPYSDNAEVLEDSIMCIIEGPKLKTLMEKFTSIAFKIMEEMSKRLQSAENLIESISLNTVEQRLAQALISLANSEDEVNLNIKKGDLASQLGMSQETLSRKLAAFQDEGIIKLSGHKKIIILDMAKLRGVLEK